MAKRAGGLYNFFKKLGCEKKGPEARKKGAASRRHRSRSAFLKKRWSRLSVRRGEYPLPCYDAMPIERRISYAHD